MRFYTFKNSSQLLATSVTTFNPVLLPQLPELPSI